MARRGAGGGAYTFDLEPDGDEESLPASGGREPGPEHRRASPGLLPRFRELLRGRRTLAAVVVAAVALTAVVVDTVGDRSRLAALRTAPGGVLELAGAPREVWRVAAEGSVPGGLVGASEGLVIAQHRDALIGIDVESGERRWSVDLPSGSNDCGPGMDLWSGVFRVEHTDRLVCVTTPVRRSGTVPPSTVTVVDRRGEVVGTREVERDGSWLSPGPRGGLVVATWSGGPENDERAVDGGYDLRVRFEDAVTGEQRWRRALAFDADVGPYLCTSWTEDGAVDELELRGEVQTRVRDETLWVGGCGIDAWLTSEGDRLDRESDPSTFEGFGFAALDGGGYVAKRGEDAFVGPVGSDRVLSSDGERSRDLDGRYLAPQSTDGSERDLLLVRRDDQVVALDAAGEERWRADVQAVALPVRTAQVAVVVDETRTVRGLDLTTGEELWTREDLFDEVGSGALTYGPHVMDGAFTDGREAAFVIPDLDRGDVLHWFAVDVATGEDLWSEATDVEDWGAHLAVDGHLVRWSPTEVVGLAAG